MNLIWPTLQPRDVRKEIGKEKKIFRELHSEANSKVQNTNKQNNNKTAVNMSI